MSTTIQQDKGIVASNATFTIDKVNFHGHTSPPTPVSSPEALLIESLKFDRMDDRRFGVEEEQLGTCGWLLETRQWLQWQASLNVPGTPRLLWIKGKAGTGKSTIMRYAVDSGHKPSCQEIVLAHFFNARSQDPLESSAEGLYRTLLVQLLTRLRRTGNIDESTAGFMPAKGGTWQLGKLASLMKVVLRSYGSTPITCFVDALDECDQSQVRDIIGRFRSIISNHHQHGGSFRVCFASRYYPHVSVPEKECLELSIEDEDGHKADIAQYIENTLIIRNHHLAQIVKDGIQAKSNGVFMWCSLVIKMLNAKHDQGQLRNKEQAYNTLEALPGELSQTYESILGLSDSSSVPPDATTLLCLQWVTFACVPLDPLELWEFLCLEEDMVQDDAGKWQPPSRDEAVLFILHASRGLAEVTTQSWGFAVVQLAHESVRDFLLRDSGLARLMSAIQGKQLTSTMAEAQSFDRLGRISTRVLDYAMPMLSQGKDNVVILKTFASMRHAILNMLSYAEGAAIRDIDQSDFLAYMDRNLSHWMILHDECCSFWARQMVLGTPCLARTLIFNNRPALTVALHRKLVSMPDGKAHVQRMLSQMLIKPISRNAILEIFDMAYKPLYALMREQWRARKIPPMADILQKYWEEQDRPHERSPILVQGGLKLEIRGWFRVLFDLVFDDETLGILFLIALAPDENLDEISAALSGGFGQVLALMVRLGIAPQVVYDWKDRALLWAAIHGHVELAQTLLQHLDVHVNSRLLDQTPLCWAIRCEQLEMIRFLLDREDTDVNAASSEGITGTTPLHTAIHSNNLAAVQLLLNRQGINVNATTSTGMTPLHTAIESCNTATVQLLLDRRDTDVNTAALRWTTPLHTAIESHNTAAVQLLLDRQGINVNATTSAGMTPLHTAIESQNTAAISLLLGRQDIRCDTRNADYRTPLMLAIENGCADSLRTMLETNRVILTKICGSHLDFLPLHYAIAVEGELAIVELLVKFGGRRLLKVRDTLGRTPWEMALLQQDLVSHSRNTVNDPRYETLLAMLAPDREQTPGTGSRSGHNRVL